MQIIITSNILFWLSCVKENNMPKGTQVKAEQVEENIASTTELGIIKVGDNLNIDVDGTLNAVVNSGDVVGPASAVDENLPIFDGVTGKLLKGSGTQLQ
jgi:hypothetical protein